MSMINADPGYKFREVTAPHSCKKHEQFPLSLDQSIDALLKGSSRSKADLVNAPAGSQVTKVVINDVAEGDITGAIFASVARPLETQKKLYEQAARNGAALIVTGSPEIAQHITEQYSGCGVVLCTNTVDLERDAVVRGLRPLAAKVREVVELPVLSVSGTSGKTTSRDLATSILRQRLNVNSTEKNDNNIWGTTASLLKLNQDHDCALYEYGSDGAGQTTFLAALTRPTVTYTSSIGIAHVSTVGGIDQMLACETEQYDWMIQHSPQSPVFVANMDDQYLQQFFLSKWNELTEAGTIFTVSSTPGKKCDFQLLKVEEIAEDHHFFSKVSVGTPFGVVNAKVPLIGRHNHANICGGLALALASGCVTVADVVDGLENPTFTGYRSDFFREPQGRLLVLNDSFNSNPTGLPVSVRMALRAKELMAGGIERIVLALGDMHALGEQSSYYHKQMGEMAKEAGVDALYCHGEFAQDYCKGFGGGASQFEDKESLYRYLVNNDVQGGLSSKTLVLVKGSPKTKTSQIVDWLREGK